MKRPSAPFTELLLDPKRGGLPGSLGVSERWNSPSEMRKNAKIVESRDRISKIIGSAKHIISGPRRFSPALREELNSDMPRVDSGVNLAQFSSVQQQSSAAIIKVDFQEERARDDDLTKDPLDMGDDGVDPVASDEEAPYDATVSSHDSLEIEPDALEEVKKLEIEKQETEALADDDPVLQIESFAELQVYFREHFLCEANLRHFTKTEQKILQSYLKSAQAMRVLLETYRQPFRLEGKAQRLFIAQQSLLERTIHFSDIIYRRLKQVRYSQQPHIKEAVERERDALRQRKAMDIFGADDEDEVQEAAGMTKE